MGISEQIDLAISVLGVERCLEIVRNFEFEEGEANLDRLGNELTEAVGEENDCDSCKLPCKCGTGFCNQI